MTQVTNFNRQVDRTKMGKYRLRILRSLYLFDRNIEHRSPDKSSCSKKFPISPNHQRATSNGARRHMEQVGATIERTVLNLQNLIQQKYEIMPQHRLTFTTLMQITLRRNQHFHKFHTEFTDFVMPSSGPSVTPPLPDQMFKTNLANSSKLSRHSQSCTTHKNELNKLFFILASRMIYIANIILGLSRSARESSAPPANLREFQLRLTEMKYLLIAATAVCAMLTEPVFAQSTPKPTLSAPTQTARDNSYADTMGQWVPPYGEPVAQKTRAQVYRELVQAENDGQLAYLNSTIYAH